MNWPLGLDFGRPPPPLILATFLRVWLQKGSQNGPPAGRPAPALDLAGKVFFESGEVFSIRKVFCNQKVFAIRSRIRQKNFLQSEIVFLNQNPFKICF